jgi:thiamine biosynthesis lipoprotein
VLSIAQELEKASRGVFDITIAPVLERWGYLPNLQNTADRLGGSAYALLRENRVQFSHALHIDLGGIAKGFAVDRAADALQGEGVSAGVVNCGGDLRAFGEETHTIHLRHPASPQHAVGAVQMANTALATSASYFSRKSFENQLVSPLLDGRRNTACVDEVSVTVIAKQSVFADALTKVVIALREESVPVLTRYGASAIILNANGQVERLP